MCPMLTAASDRRQSRETWPGARRSNTASRTLKTPPLTTVAPVQITRNHRERFIIDAFLIRISKKVTATFVHVPSEIVPVPELTFVIEGYGREYVRRRSTFKWWLVRGTNHAAKDHVRLWADWRGVCQPKHDNLFGSGAACFHSWADQSTNSQNGQDPNFVKFGTIFCFSISFHTKYIKWRVFVQVQQLLTLTLFSLSILFLCLYFLNQKKWWHFSSSLSLYLKHMPHALCSFQFHFLT